MHNGNLADPGNSYAQAIKKLTGKRKKTESDYDEIAHLEFLGGLYVDGDGPCVPAEAVTAMVYAAAAKRKEKTGFAKPGCYCTSHARLEYDGPRTPETLWLAERFRYFRCVGINRQARIMRMRPIFEEWSAEIDLSVETTLVDLGQVDEWMQIAGTQIGLLERRPMYGRFTAERLDGA